jgi:hypothetical protein
VLAPRLQMALAPSSSTLVDASPCITTALSIGVRGRRASVSPNDRVKRPRFSGHLSREVIPAVESPLNVPEGFKEESLHGRV